MIMFDRVVTFILEAIGSKLWGFKPNLMQHFVDQHGPGQSMYWFATNMPKYEKILKELGPIRTHLLVSAISIMNACRYCHTGHAEAFQLHFLRIHGEIFPMDTDEMFALRGIGIDNMIHSLEDALTSSGLKEEVPTLKRLVKLYWDPSQTRQSEDASLIHLISMFKVLNQCGIEANATIDAVHDPINRDTVLINRHKHLREKSS